MRGARGVFGGFPAFLGDAAGERAAAGGERAAAGRERAAAGGGELGAAGTAAFFSFAALLGCEPATPSFRGILVPTPWRPLIRMPRRRDGSLRVSRLTLADLFRGKRSCR